MPIETLSADTAEVRLLQAAPKMPEALRRAVVRALYRRAYAFLDTETGEVTVSPAGHRAASNALAGEGFTKRTRGGVAYVWSPPKPTLEELQAADAKCAELQAWLRDYLARAGQDVPR